MVAQLRENGKVQRGWLGVQIQPVTPETGRSLGLGEPKGALVTDVVPDSPAAKAGLQQGDVILRFDGRRSMHMRDLPRMVADTPADKSVELGIWRSGHEVKQAVTIARQDKRALELAQGETPDTAPSADNSAELVDSGTLGTTLSSLSEDARQRYQIADDVKGVVITGVEPGGVAPSRACARAM